MTGLYIHVPLCISRCRYCDFYKMTPQEWDNVALYIRCLEIELGRLPGDFVPDTVFIGGGTPTALETKDYVALLGAIHRSVDLSRVVEFSSEANPGTLTPEKLAIMKEGGINRVSIGVQSFNKKALRLLGRVHSPEQAIEGYRMLRDAGFDNVNIDLIQSIPGMDPSDVREDVRKVVELNPEHIAYYNLIYESGTPMAHDRDAGRIIPPGDEVEADNYFAIKKMLKDAGYNHYEISNFSRDQKHCLHNILYWQGGEYFGCGPSAHSHWSGGRFGNICDLPDWCDRLQNGMKPFDKVETLSSHEKARETLAMWLRMIEGVDLDHFKKVTGHDAAELCAEVLPGLMKEGLLLRRENRLALAPTALFICNSVFSELF